MIPFRTRISIYLSAHYPKTILNITALYNRRGPQQLAHALLAPKRGKMRAVNHEIEMLFLIGRKGSAQIS